MIKNPIGWFEIYVNDMARAKTFYEAVFELSLTELPAPEISMFAFPMNNNDYGASGALVKMSGMNAGNNSVVIYFHCQDCAVEEARIIQFGGSIEKSKYSIGDYGYITLAYDTEGNMIGLHTLPEKPHTP